MTVAAGALLVTASFPQAAHATSTRAYTLGVMNRFIIDDANRWLYPHTIANFGSLFYVELFGTAPSRATAAPGSQRVTNTPGGAGLTGALNLDLQTYDAVDSVPVMQSAGGGAIIKLTDDLFIAMHLSDYENTTVPSFLALLATQSTGDPTLAPGWLSAPPDAPGSANRKIDLFLAYNLQDLAKFGLELSFGSSKYSRTPNDNDAPVLADLQGGEEARKNDSIKTTELGFNLGIGLDLGEAAAVDGAFGMIFHSLTYLPNDRDLIEGGGGVEMRADVRAMIGLTEWWELVPALSFRYSSLSAADIADYSNGLVYVDGAEPAQLRAEYFITDVSAKRIIFDLGVAGHFKPTEFLDFWAATGVQFGSWSASFENKIADAAPELMRDENLEISRDSMSHDAVPYVRFALEARLLSWLDFRAGVIKFLRADTVTEDKLDDQMPENNRLNDVTRDYPFFDYFVGAAVHYEGFFLDFQVDPNWFLRGPDILSGSGGNMFINASLGYRF
jgi:hypothetical protein